MVIAPDEPLTGRLPLRAVGEKDSKQLVAEFDYGALEALGYVKFDLLTLRTIDTLQVAIDLIRETTGQQINPYSWRAEYEDPLVWDMLGDGFTLGVFQVETRPGTRLCRRVRPKNLLELADVLTLVRPGPSRSGLTDAYLRRRDGLEEVTVPDPRLADVLAPTQGAILYQ